MSRVGTVLLVLGALIGLYALAIFDPSVTAGGGRVINMGLLQDRQNMLIAGCALAVVGAIMFGFGRLPAAEPERPMQFDQTDWIGGRSTQAPAPTGYEDEFSNALRAGEGERIKEMIASGKANLRGEFDSGRGWLQFAASTGSAPAVKALLEAGAKPDGKDGQGFTALELAQRDGRDEIVAMLRAAMTGDTDEPTTTAPTGSGAPISAAIDVPEQLRQLALLRSQGALSEHEFAIAKERVLGTDTHPGV